MSFRMYVDSAVEYSAWLAGEKHVATFVTRKDSPSELIVCDVDKMGSSESAATVAKIYLKSRLPQPIHGVHVPDDAYSFPTFQESPEEPVPEAL
jgi:hypothetical protein